MSIEPDGRLRTFLRDAARQAWEAALEASDPGEAVTRALRLDDGVLRAGDHALPLAAHADVLVLAFGKAAVPMAEAALRVLGARVSRGLVVTKDGHARGARTIGTLRVEEAAHPVPDARGERAAREMLDLARGRALDDLALVLVSGGGSALTACPDGELTLDDVAAVTEALLRSGADIRELNCVRKHLSAFAGGRLAQALGASRSLTLAVSDVVGDDPSTIASGPTVPDPTTYAEALAVLESRLPAEALPAPVLRHLAEGAAGRMAETPAGSELPEERHRHVVIASAARALESADRRLGALGFEVTSLGADMSADAAAVAADHVARLVALHAGSRRPVALVRAGETTVRVTGSGTGGRNQHLAASAAASLDALGPTVPGELVVVAFATDGTDGPTDAAGGIVDRGSWKRVLASGADPARRLADFDSNAFLRASGDLILTGPTGTNVMDLVLGLAARAPPSR